MQKNKYIPKLKLINKDSLLNKISMLEVSEQYMSDEQFALRYNCLDIIKNINLSILLVVSPCSKIMDVDFLFIVTFLIFALIIISIKFHLQN